MKLFKADSLFHHNLLAIDNIDAFGGVGDNPSVEVIDGRSGCFGLNGRDTCTGEVGIKECAGIGHLIFAWVVYIIVKNQAQKSTATFCVAQKVGTSLEKDGNRGSFMLLQQLATKGTRNTTNNLIKLT